MKKATSLGAVFLLCILLSITAITGCGGGGGGGGNDRPHPPQLINYFPQAVGDTWTGRKDSNSKTVQATVEKKETYNNKSCFVLSASMDDDESNMANRVNRKKGYIYVDKQLTTSILGGYEVDTTTGAKIRDILFSKPIVISRANLKDGSTWEVTDVDITYSPDTTDEKDVVEIQYLRFSAQEIGKLTEPCGTFANCVRVTIQTRVRLRNNTEAEYTMTLCLAPGVGPVESDYNGKHAHLIDFTVK